MLPVTRVCGREKFLTCRFLQHLLLHASCPMQRFVSQQAVEVGEPNNTLYIKNLNEKYSKAKVLDELKDILRKKFSPYGEILDIVALSNFYSKGQVSLTGA